MPRNGPDGLRAAGELTLAEAAARLGVGSEKVRALFRERIILGHKRGGMWFVSASELLRYEREQRA